MSTFRVDRCSVRSCQTVIDLDDDAFVCRHDRPFCLACDPRDGCDECQQEWIDNLDIEEDANV